MDRCDGKRKILVERAERAEKPRRSGYFDRIGGRIDRLFGSHCRGISQNRNLEMHHPSDPQLHPLCIV